MAGRFTGTGRGTFEALLSATWEFQSTGNSIQSMIGTKETGLMKDVIRILTFDIDETKKSQDKYAMA